jgi:hypothetical protein
MKQLLSLFLLLVPCLALAQYPSNGNQKITLGEQTTADGLIWRGVAADTTTTVKSDTAAYFVLDTVNKKLYFYKVSATPKWNEISGSGGGGVTTFSGGTTGLTPSTATSGAVTLAGTLAVANGGTNITTLSAAYRIPYASSITSLTTSSNLTYNNSTLTIGNENDNYDNLALKNKATTNNTTRRIGMTANTYEGDSLIGLLSVYANASSRQITFGGGVSNLKNPTEINFYTSTNVESPIDRGARLRMFINDIGNVGIGTSILTERLHVVGNGRFTAVGAGTFSNNLNITSDGTLTTATSDEKFKYNIRPLNYGLETLLQLKPVNFQWIEGEEEDLGFIAQDVAEIIPEAVNTNWNSDLLFRYESLIPILTKAIQEQQALIKALEQRIINLENK